MRAEVPICHRRGGFSDGLRLIALVCAFLVTVYAPAQKVDLNGNGMSDIWEWTYNVYGINPNADPDGDGFFNWQEAIADTDPLNSNSYPHIPVFFSSSSNFSVTLPCAPGKVYTLWGITNWIDANWGVETNIEPLSGTNLTLNGTVGPMMKFYLVGISDTNSDGTGLMNDREKLQLGLGITNAYSNGQQDFNGNPLSDYAYVTNMLASQNVIGIAASDPTASEPDPGQKSTATGLFTITRGGFPLDNITVNLGVGGPGIGFAAAGTDYSALPTSVFLPAGVSSTSLTLTPLANANLPAPVIAQLEVLPGANYTVGQQSNATMVIYPSPTASGTGLLGQYYTNSSTTYTNAANFNSTNLFLTRVDPAIDFNWTNGTSPDLSNGLYTVRWTGQVQPQFSDTYFFAVESESGCRLWVNDQLLINEWQKQGLTTWTNAIAMQGGTRYDIKLEYLQDGGPAQAHLFWYSPDQAEEIIPNSCLYPTNSYSPGSSNAPAAITSALNAVAFLGQPFSFTVTAANTPLRYTANGLPPGLVFNNTNGLINGIPTVAGNFDVTLTASNLLGTGASAVDILVLNTGSSVVQEIWTNVPGTNIADIPLSTPANITNVVGALQGANDGINYGERVRGYFTAPVTGNYYFWIAGSDSAQLWISDDNNQVNQVLRSWVTPTNNPVAPGENGTSPGQWSIQPSQQSGWLSLVAGQQYYLQVLHKAGAGTNANWSAGWLQDPTGTNNNVSGIVPGYLLSRYYPPLSQNIPGTLYSANLLALPGVVSRGVGSATLRVNASGTQATLSFTITNLVGTPTGESINSDPYQNDPGELIFDISAAKPQPNGTYLWNIKGTGPLQTNDILQIISQGKAAIVIESTAFANGEIGGHFTLANGSQTFTPLRRRRHGLMTRPIPTRPCGS